MAKKFVSFDAHRVVAELTGLAGNPAGYPPVKTRSRTMFEDLEAFLDGRLPIVANGHTFYVPEPSAKEGLRLQRLFAYGSARIDHRTELEEILKLLGPVWDEMASAGVGYTKAVAAGRVALIHYAISPEVARAYAAGDELVKALPPKRLLRRVRGSASAGTAPKGRGFARPGLTGRGTLAGVAGSPSSASERGSAT